MTTTQELLNRIDHLERERIQVLEKRIAALEQGLLVLTTAVGLARWFGPFFVSIAAIVLVLLKG